MSTGLFADEEDGYNLEEEVKYKIKLAAPSTPALDVSTPPEIGSGEPNLDLGNDEVPGEIPSDDKPFDDTPFDAGVEADEDESPEKYIQQLAGKLGTTLRKYSEDKGQPDFDLEKFAINSVISATHTSQMDAEDQKDIISKIKNSGENGKDIDVNVDVDTDSSDEEGGIDDIEPSQDEVEIDEPLEESGDPLFQTGDRGFAPNADNQMWESDELIGNDYELNEDSGNVGLKNEMFFNNIHAIYEDVSKILKMNPKQIDSLLSNGHGWAIDHLSTSTNDIEHIYHYFEGQETVNEVESNNYMFFQNLKTLQHATHGILDMDVTVVDDEISNNDEWISNLAATAKDDVEEVYHYLTGQIVSENKIKGVDGKSCWKGYRYDGTENGKDKCVKVSETIDNSEKNSIFGNDVIKKLEEMENMLKLEYGNAPVKEPVVLPQTPVKPSRRRERIWETEPVKSPKPKM